MPLFSNTSDPNTQQPRGIGDAITGRGSQSGGGLFNLGNADPNNPIMMLFGLSGIIRRNQEAQSLQEQRKLQIEALKKKFDASRSFAAKLRASGKDWEASIVENDPSQIDNILGNEFALGQQQRGFTEQEKQDALKAQQVKEAATALSLEQEKQAATRAGVEATQQEQAFKNTPEYRNRQFTESMANNLKTLEQPMQGPGFQQMGTASAQGPMPAVDPSTGQAVNQFSQNQLHNLPADANVKGLSQITQISDLTPDESQQIAAGLMGGATEYRTALDKIKEQRLTALKQKTTDLPVDIQGYNQSGGDKVWGPPGKDSGYALYEQTMKKAGSTQIDMGTAESSDEYMRRKLVEAQAPELAKAVETADNAANVIQSLNTIEPILNDIPDGILGMASRDILSRYPQLTKSSSVINAVVKGVAPSLRTPGSGTTSDLDYEGFLASLPQLQNYPGANKLIVQVLRDRQQFLQERADIIQSFADSEITGKQRTTKLRELNNRRFITPEMKAKLKEQGIDIPDINYGSKTPPELDPNKYLTPPGGQ